MVLGMNSTAATIIGLIVLLVIVLAIVAVARPGSETSMSHGTSRMSKPC
jgi:hypothetical protein